MKTSDIFEESYSALTVNKVRTSLTMLGIIIGVAQIITLIGLGNGIKKDVTFMEVSDPDINDQVDAAYRSKYGHYEAEYVDPMVTPEARAATISLEPR